MINDETLLVRAKAVNPYRHEQSKFGIGNVSAASGAAIWLSILILALPPSSRSDVIHLRNGKRLSVDRTWQEGGKIHYEKNGNIFGFSKALVARVEVGVHASDPDAEFRQSHSQKPVPVEVLDESLDISEGLYAGASEVLKDGKIDHERLRTIENDARLAPGNSSKKIRYLNALRDLVLWNVQNNDLRSAQSLIEPYLRLDPDNLQANLTLAWLHLKQGQYQQGENILLRSKVKNDQSPDLLYLLGLAYYLQDKNDLAGRMLRQSLELRYRPEVEQLFRKIEQENRAENDFKQANSLHFVIRYEGSATNHSLGQGILASLEQSFAELQSQLDFSPRESIAVVLYPDETFQDVTRTPRWVGALNDGKIRFPIKGLSVVDRSVRNILKHELTHSFVRLKTAGNCPVWLNEGLAQYLSGDSSREFVALAKQAIAQNRFPPLSKLEGPFLTLGTSQAAWAYQQSLLAVEFLVAGYGLSDVQALLEQAGRSASFEAALQTVLRRDYADLQKEFEEYVKRQN